MGERAQTVAVLGGTGFIGRHVVARLLAAGYRVIVLARGRRPMAVETEGEEHAQLRACELAAPIDPELLAGCEVVVNLVGVKTAKGIGFERAHVELPLELAAAARALGVEQLIHVSVAGCEHATADDGPYLDSKARGERALAEVDGPAITILRPGVVYGAGDDMLRNIADSIRVAPLFPAPRGGRSQLQPIAVEDVAEAVLRAIERPSARGRSYDLVGPERVELRELIARVARALGTSSWRPRCLVVGAPLVVTRAAAGLLEQIAPDPLITRSQLGLLARGVVGDPGPAATELGLEPGALDETAITRALADFEPRLPSLRLVPDARAARELAERGGAERSRGSAFAVFAVLAVVALLLGPLLPGSIWLRMAGLELVLSLLAFAGLRLSWGALARPSASALAWGLGGGVVMWAGAFGVAALLSALSPALWSETSSLYAWAELLPVGTALALLTVIVAGEEIVWRGALGLGLAARIGPGWAVLASAALFCVAHLSTGPPVLAIAAALAGGAWTWLAIRTRSLFASFVAHLGWDAAMLWLTPLTG